MSNDCRNTLTINTDDKTLMEITDLVKELYEKKISQ